MKQVERSDIRRAFNGILNDASLIDKIPNSKKKRAFINSYQNYLYNKGSRVDAETCLAWAIGFGVILEDKP